MRLTPKIRAPGLTEQARRRRARVAAIAIVALLVAACQAGGTGTPLPTMPPTDPAPARSAASAPVAPPAPVASALASPTTAAVVASPTTTATVPSRSPAPAIDPRSDGLDVIFDEFAITLEASVIRPGPVTLIVHNAGLLTHGLEMKIRGSGSGGDRERIETRTFHPGETLRVEVDLPAGVYEVECYVADHASKGMHTTLEVRADAPLVAAATGAAVAGTARIVQFAFVAATLDVAAGTRVTWTNDDPAPHTVTADGGAFDSRQLDPGASFSVVLDRPGAYAYHCEIHPTMVGTVIVH